MQSPGAGFNIKFVDDGYLFAIAIGLYYLVIGNPKIVYILSVNFIGILGSV